MASLSVPRTTVLGSRPKLALPVLVLSQVFATSLWFSGSAVLPELSRSLAIGEASQGLLLTAVQAGFLLGTLLFAVSNLADRFAPSRVFLACALAGAAANALFVIAAYGLAGALVVRFATGVALAGIYPVGMKLAVSFAPRAAGRALGWLVGALTLGSSLPFLLRALGSEVPAVSVVLASSALTIIAGILVWALGDGPHLPQAERFRLGIAFRLFRIPDFRRAALGYFGHMWEVYAFWALTPRLLGAALDALGWESRLVPLGTFFVFALGFAGCVAGGILSQRVGSERVAASSLLMSGSLCVAAPALLAAHPGLFLAALGLWAVWVVSDSPQFSALSACACPPSYVGTALTIQSSIGFALSIVSIEWTMRWWGSFGPGVVWVLAPGPFLGLAALLWSRRRSATCTTISASSWKGGLSCRQAPSTK